MPDFYYSNSKRFFDESVNLDLSSLYKRFLKYVPSKGKILDAGCGSGRDTKYFTKEGYRVTAFDGSSCMAKLACEYTGADVKHLKLEDLDLKDQFDAIWASASLLHLKRKDLKEVFRRLSESLMPTGILYGSVIYRDKEREDEAYIESNEIQIIPYFETWFSVLEIWKEPDFFYPELNNETYFLNFILKKIE